MLGVFAIAPVAFVAGNVPSVFRGLELVIGFRIVGAVVTLFPEIDWEGFYFGREHGIAAHVVGP